MSIRLQILACLLVAGFLSIFPARAQGQNRLPDEHSPRGALWRAAAVPGWGQLYNRQYYKVPIVYAGLGGLAASALLVNREYIMFRRAKLFIDPQTSESFPQYESDYLRLIETKDIPAGRQGSQLVPYLKSSRDNLRRNRDLLYIGIGLFYGLSILDAYVSAHLLDFDVSEDLSLSVHPATGGFTAKMRFGR